MLIKDIESIDKYLNKYRKTLSIPAEWVVVKIFFKKQLKLNNLIELNNDW